MACSGSMKVVGDPKCTVTAGEGRSGETSEKAVISFDVNFSFSDGSETAVLRRTLETVVEVLMWDSYDAANEHMISRVLTQLNVPKTHTCQIAKAVLAGIANVAAVTTWWLGFSADVTIHLLLTPI